VRDNVNRLFYLRHYNCLEKSELIDFNTKLNIKSSGQETTNSVKLYPINLNKHQNLLLDAGFKDCVVFGSFKRETLNEIESTPDYILRESINDFEYQDS
jgi:hypothetical protein